MPRTGRARGRASCPLGLAYAPEPCVPEVADDDPDAGPVDVKEAARLPGALPPIRLPSTAELPAQARSARCPAGWPRSRPGRGGGPRGHRRPRPDAGRLGWRGPRARRRARRPGVPMGVRARRWSGSPRRTATSAWCPARRPATGRHGRDGLRRVGRDAGRRPRRNAAHHPPGRRQGLDRLGLGGIDFVGQATALTVLLFLAQQEHLTVAEFTEVLFEDTCGDMPAAQAARVRATSEEHFGDPALLSFVGLGDLRAVTQASGVVRLTPLALTALREQLAEAGVKIPLCRRPRGADRRPAARRRRGGQRRGVRGRGRRLDRRPRSGAAARGLLGSRPTAAPGNGCSRSRP